MRTKLFMRCSLILAVTALVLGFGSAGRALAVQASGSVSLIPSDNSLELNQLVDIVVRVTNTSSETGDEGADPVPATYLAGGATLVNLACADAACTTQLPGTLQFVPVGGTGCVSGQPGVTCVASGTNGVSIMVGSDLVIATFANLAVIRVMAVIPVFDPASGAFFQRAETGPNDLEALSLVNLELPPVTGGAQGSTVYTFPGNCDVRVDKQISCDGGQTWVDAGLVNSNEDGTVPCQALSTDLVLVRYQVSNLGTFEAGGCTLTDLNSNPIPGMPFGDPADPGSIPPGFTSPFLPGTAPALCSAWETFEPNTVTLTCQTCAGVPRPGDPLLTAADSATFGCLTADLKVDRAVACVDGAPAGFNDQLLVYANEDGTDGPTTLNGKLCSWQYQANNPGEATLYDCVLTDSNPNVTPSPIPVGTLAPGALVAIPAANTLLCSDALEANEVPGGQVNLACCSRDVDVLINCPAENRLQVFDISTVQCLQPGLDVDKQCLVNTDTLEATFTVTTRNTGEVNLEDCTAIDRLYTAGACPPSGAFVDQPLAPAGPFPLAAGSDPFVQTGGATLADHACNWVEVTCYDSVAGDPLVRTDTADCEVPSEGCLTRTPGFWGTHPAVTFLYLPLQVCGVTIDNVRAGSGASATEAMCSVGTDAKIIGPQWTQLVRQCTAAALNIAATVELEGDCSSDYPGIEGLFAACCATGSICDTGVQVGTYSRSYCINELDMFNNWGPDTLYFDFPVGPANPTKCRGSKNNGVVVNPFAP